MKFLLFSLALLSFTTNAATVCFKSNILAISNIEFLVKNSDQNVVNMIGYNDIMITGQKCIDFNEREHTVTLKVFHLTGLVWEPKVNTCTYENINQSKKVTSHGTTLFYHCNDQDM
jgi:hypothetical protein